ncbi:MAG TPA: hypothetical protein VH416_06515 [Gaiellaceae bacterium]|jgi:hypothetical protein
MEPEPPRTRIESTRRSLLATKRGLAVASVIAFAVAAAVARGVDVHGTASSDAGSSVSQSDDGGESGDFFFGGDDGAIAPSQGSPQGSTSQS